MPPTPDTSVQVGPAPADRRFAGMDRVEIKVTVRPDEELRAERAMRVDEDTAEIRLLYYYDTPDLDLFTAGVSLRARLVKGDDDDSTVKFRSASNSTFSEEWRSLAGFKLELDWVGDRTVCSASLTRPQQRDEITRVEKGERPIAKLFSRDQERFLAEVYKTPVDYAKLCVMGPIRVLRWKLEHEGFPHELTVEEWRLPNGDDLVEISIKTSPEEAHEAQGTFDNHLRALGLDPQGAQETKTRTAMEYFARACRKAS